MCVCVCVCPKNQTRRIAPVAPDGWAVAVHARRQARYRPLAARDRREAQASAECRARPCVGWGLPVAVHAMNEHLEMGDHERRHGRRLHAPCDEAEAWRPTTITRERQQPWSRPAPGFEPRGLRREPCQPPRAAVSTAARGKPSAQRRTTTTTHHRAPASPRSTPWRPARPRHRAERHGAQRQRKTQPPPTPTATTNRPPTATHEQTTRANSNHHPQAD